MKDKRPIEVQVADLTEEQKREIPKIFRIHLIITILIVGVYLACLLLCWMSAGSAKAEVESIEAKKATASLWESLGLTREWLAAQDRYDAAMHTFFMVSIGGAAVLCVVALGVQFYLTKKYPYYSEKKHFYLRKMAR